MCRIDCRARVDAGRPARTTQKAAVAWARLSSGGKTSGPTGEKLWGQRWQVPLMNLPGNNERKRKELRVDSGFTG